MTTALYSSNELPEAKAYWALGPQEPLGGGLGNVFVYEHFDVALDPESNGNLYLAHLLNLFNCEDYFNYGGSHLLVGHGTNEAINLGLSKESPAVLRLKDLVLLCKYMNDEATDEQIEKKFKVVAMNMYDIIARFHMMSLRHLAIRACNIGNNDQYLLKLAELLNVSSISAPIRRDFFSAINPMQVTLDTFNAKAHKVYNSYIMGSGEDLLMLNFEKGSKPTRFKTHAVATSEKAVNDFYAANFKFRSPVKFKWKMTLPIFGINKNHNRMPLVPIFPAHPEYTQYLKVLTNPKFVAYPPPAYLPPLVMPPLPKEDPKKPRLLRRIFRKLIG